LIFVKIEAAAISMVVVVLNGHKGPPIGVNLHRHGPLDELGSWRQ